MKKIGELLQKLKALYKKPVVIIATVAVLAAAGVGGYFLFGNNKAEDNAKKANTSTVVNNDVSENAVDGDQTDAENKEDENKEEETEVIKSSYVVTFYDYDKKTVLQEATEVTPGGKAVYKGTDPFRKESVSHTYEFAGWDKPLSPIEDDTVFYAVYNATEKPYYNVVFYDDDQNTVLQRKIVYDGQLPSYTGEVPDKETDTAYYTFTGWNKNFDLIYQDTTYVAKYSSTAKKEYEIVFYNEDGSTLQAKRKFYEGQYPKYYGSTPTKAKTDYFTYEFAGWTPSISKVRSDASYTATYNAIEIPGIVEFSIARENVKVFPKAGDGSVTIKDYFTGDGANGTIYGTKYKTVEIAGSAYNSNADMTEIKKVTIPSTVKTIGNYAFANNTSLKSIVLSKELEKIDVSAFENCVNLTDITFSGTKAEWSNLYKKTNWDANTANYVVHCSDGDIKKNEEDVKIAGGAVFNDGAYLTWSELVEGKDANKYSYDNSSITTSSLGIGFDYCNTLTEIYIPKTVTKITSSALRGCVNLKTIIVNKENAVYSSYNNNVIVDVENKTLVSACQTSTIPCVVETIGSGAFSYMTSTKGIYIPMTVKYINPQAFEECDGLEVISIPSSVQNLPYKVFYGCGALKTLYLSNTIQSFGPNAIAASGLEDIYYNGTPEEWNAIDKTTNDFTDINIHFKNELSYGYAKFKDGNIITWRELQKQVNGEYYGYDYTRISNTIIDAKAFDSCKELVYINIPSTVKAIKEEAFSYCYYLNEVVLNEGLESIGSQAFYNCGNITSINIPSSVINVDYGVFAYCSNLSSIAVDEDNPVYSSFDCNIIVDITKQTGEPKNIIVAGCKSSVIPDGIKAISDMAFYGVSLANELSIPSSVRSIGQYAFANVLSTKTMYIDKSVTYIGNYALYSSTLEDIYYSGTRAQWDDLINYLQQNYHVDAIFDAQHTYVHCSDDNLANGYVIFTDGRRVNWTDLDESVNYNKYEYNYSVIADQVVGDAAFIHNRYIQEVCIPEGTTSIGANAFNDCANLKKVVLSSTIETIEHFAFANDTNLCDIEVNDGLITICDYAFEDCTSLKNFDFPNSLESICERAFNSSGLIEASIYLNYTYAANPSYPKGICESAFEGCEDLTYVSLDGRKERYNLPCGIIRDSAFKDCISLSTIDIRDGIGPIGSYAFANTPITSLVIPARASVSASVVAGCDNLTSIIVDKRNGVYSDENNNAIICMYDNENYLLVGCSTTTVGESVKEIESYAFDSILSLKSITISNNLYYINKNAFNNCSNLVDIYYDGTTDEWEDINKVTDWDYGTGEYTIHCLDGDISKNPPLQTLMLSFMNLFTSNKTETEEVETVNVDNNQIVSTEEQSKQLIDTLVKEELSNENSVTSANNTNDNIQFNSTSESGSSSTNTGKVESTSKTDANSFSVTSSNRGVIGYSDTSSSLEIPNKIVGDGKNGTTNGVTYTINTVAGKAFEDCTNLEIVTIDNGITAIETDAFRNCSNLVTINVPSSVTSIGDDAFYNCGKLTSINYSGTKAQWNSVNKWYNWNSKTGAYTVRCSDGTIGK